MIFRLGRFQLGTKNRIRVQPGNLGRPHESPFHHIAVPVDVAGVPVFAECPPPGQNCIGPVWLSPFFF